MHNNKSLALARALKKIAPLVTVAFICILLFSGASPADEDYLPRKWEKFELDKTMNELKNDLTLFKCNEPTSKATRCTLAGYPGRDDFVVLKFYRNKLASAARFRYKTDWEKTLTQLKERLGDPTFSAYRSSRAVAYIWQDNQTHITLTHLLEHNYVIYEIRDVATEALYRKSVAGSSSD